MYTADSSTQHVVEALAGKCADRYVADLLLPPLAKSVRSIASVPAIKDGLLDPYCCLTALYEHYAFSRRGKDRQELASLASRALQRARERGDLLEHKDASILWQEYLTLCAERKRKPMEQLNQGPIAGLLELAQEIYRLDGIGSIAGWTISGLAATDRVENQFLRIVDIRGVGPKVTSVFLRDVVFLFAQESRLDHIDRLYVQPIDKWIRLLAPHVLGEEGLDEAADWVLAGKMAKHARRSGVSGIRLNMGMSYFGMTCAKSPDKIAECLDDLLS